MSSGIRGAHYQIWNILIQIKVTLDFHLTGCWITSTKTSVNTMEAFQHLTMPWYQTVVVVKWITKISGRIVTLRVKFLRILTKLISSTEVFTQWTLASMISIIAWPHLNYSTKSTGTRSTRQSRGKKEWNIWAFLRTNLF